MLRHSINVVVWRARPLGRRDRRPLEVFAYNPDGALPYFHVQYVWDGTTPSDWAACIDGYNRRDLMTLGELQRMVTAGGYQRADSQHFVAENYSIPTEDLEVLQEQARERARAATGE